jgi:hypothetical protein
MIKQNFLHLGRFVCLLLTVGSLDPALFVAITEVPIQWNSSFPEKIVDLFAKELERRKRIWNKEKMIIKEWIKILR